MKRSALLFAILHFPTAPSGHTESFDPRTLMEIEILENGNILVAEGGVMPFGVDGGVYEIDRDGEVVWSYRGDLLWTHSAERTPDGTTLISDTNNDQVILVDNETKEVLWDSDEYPLSDGSHLDYPNDASLLADSGNRLICDRDNHRILEITSGGSIVWQFGVTGESGHDERHLFGPHNADRLPNGNTIFSDSHNNRILEVNPEGEIVWRYEEGMEWCRDADRLANGNTLITDSINGRVFEVTLLGQMVWEFTGLTYPYDSERLENGNTLISNSRQILEVNQNGEVVWTWPIGFRAPETVWIENPASGVPLYCHIHRPTLFDPAKKYPAAILVPSATHPGTRFDRQGWFRMIADAGFITVHFDPDGRGRSGGVEDFCGPIHQTGLNAVIDTVMRLPEVDPTGVGLYSENLGLAMAAGALASRKDVPRVKFLMDFEGPCDRFGMLFPYGPVLHATEDDPWWIVREPLRVAPQLRGCYLRIQTAQDGSGLGNTAACVMTNTCTHCLYGGGGLSSWTRVNSADAPTFNPPNRLYDSSEPPGYLADAYDSMEHRILLLREYVRELTAVPLDVDADLIPDASEGERFPAPDLSNPFLFDSDGDGLWDGEEDLNRDGNRQPETETKVRARDSDGDQYPDGIESRFLASDPLDPCDPYAAFADGDGDEWPTSLDQADGNPDSDGDRFYDGYEEVMEPGSSEDPQAKPILADTHEDGFVDNGDAQVLLNFFAHQPFAGANPENGDVDRNGILDNADAESILAFFGRRLPLLPRPR